MLDKHCMPWLESHCSNLTCAALVTIATTKSGVSATSVGHWCDIAVTPLSPTINRFNIYGYILFKGRVSGFCNLSTTSAVNSSTGTRSPAPTHSRLISETLQTKVTEVER